MATTYHHKELPPLHPRRIDRIHPSRNDGSSVISFLLSHSLPDHIERSLVDGSLFEEELELGLLEEEGEGLGCGGRGLGGEGCLGD